MNGTCSPSTLLNYSHLCLGLNSRPGSPYPPDDCFPAKDKPRNVLANSSCSGYFYFFALAYQSSGWTDTLVAYMFNKAALMYLSAV